MALSLALTPPGCRTLLLLVAIILALQATRATAEEVTLVCTSGFVICEGGKMICNPGSIICRNGILVCGTKTEKGSCSMEGNITSPKPSVGPSSVSGVEGTGSTTEGKGEETPFEPHTTESEVPNVTLFEPSTTKSEVPNVTLFEPSTTKSEGPNVTLFEPSTTESEVPDETHFEPHTTESQVSNETHFEPHTSESEVSDETRFEPHTTESQVSNETYFEPHTSESEVSDETRFEPTTTESQVSNETHFERHTSESEVSDKTRFEPTTTESEVSGSEGPRSSTSGPLTSGVSGGIIVTSKPEEQGISDIIERKFIRLFSLKMASRGIKVEDVKVQYTDRRHPGAKITVTAVQGQFSGYHPEVFVGWNHLMSTKSEYIVQTRIVTLTTGELFTNIYVSDPAAFTTVMMVPVRVKLGIGQFLTTTTLKKGSGMGSGVFVKAEKLVIDDVQVLAHPREVVRKLGLQRLNSLVKKVVNSHTLEKSLASAMRKEWKSTYVPLPRARLPTYSYEK